MSHDVSSDTEALRRRIQQNVAGASSNLEDWIIQQVRPSAGMRVLDLGCGTGKQVFVLESLISPGGSILGVDLSAQAVEEVNQRAQRDGLPHVKAIEASLDDCAALLRNERFDLIVSTYAIYYATNEKQLLCDLRNHLTEQGRVFVCGPGQGTNQEIVDLVNGLSAENGAKADPIDDFLSQADVDQIARFYSGHEIVRLPNSISFTSTDGVMQWWKNHNSFLPQAHDGVARALDDHIAIHGKFKLTKNVLGIALYA
jgi:ubiquinone/menaquinone biosynthesis C-methylase UbiE